MIQFLDVIHRHFVRVLFGFARNPKESFTAGPVSAEESSTATPCPHHLHMNHPRHRTDYEKLREASTPAEKPQISCTKDELDGLGSGVAESWPQHFFLNLFNLNLALAFRA